MFGNNVIRKPTIQDSGVLDVVEIFKTFQGEGPYTGHKAIFVRLGGCNLACKFCDTEFDTYKSYAVQQVYEQVQLLSGDHEIRLVVITGGEPFLQPLYSICELLINGGFEVQIETNGTLYRDVPDGVKIVCSPKNTGSGFKVLRADLLQRLSCVKFLISKHRSEYSFVPDVGQKDYNIPVYIQPMDEYNEEKNAQNLQFVIDLCLKYKYHLSVQMHKVLGVM